MDTLIMNSYAKQNLFTKTTQLIMYFTCKIQRTPKHTMCDYKYDFGNFEQTIPLILNTAHNIFIENFHCGFYHLKFRLKIPDRNYHLLLRQKLKQVILNIHIIAKFTFQKGH